MTFPGSINKAAVGESTAAQNILQAVLDTAREGVLIADSATRITAGNRAAVEAFAWQDGKLVGKRLSEIIRNPALHEAFQAAIAYGASRDIDGLPYATGVFYDVTQIERLEKVRQEFLSNISHELRTPLTAIMAFVETLEDGAIEDPENNRRFLGVIRRNAERMHALIADILELSLIESGNVSVELKSVNLSTLVEEVFSALSANAASRGVVLNNDVRAGSRVFADPARLEQ